MGIATRGRESERCIGGMLAARNMLIRKFGGTQYTAVLLRISSDRGDDEATYSSHVPLPEGMGAASRERGSSPPLAAC